MADKRKRPERRERAQQAQRPQGKGSANRAAVNRAAANRAGASRPAANRSAAKPTRPASKPVPVRSGDFIEGRRAAAEALRTGFPVKRALVADGQGSDAALTKLVEQIKAAGVPVKRVPREELDALSSHGAHQGVALEVGTFPYASMRDVLDRAGEGPALVVVLDHVTDDGNFGAIVRTAEVVGAAGVVIANKRAAGVTVGSYKTSAGAVMHLPIVQVPNIARALDDLKEQGFWVGGASEHAAQVCWDSPFEGRLALVMGSEGNGISRLVLEKCDFLTKLPQRGQTESLNVAQAATALCFEWARRNRASLEEA